MELVKTWIEGLDEVFGEDLPDKSVVLMMEEPGSGYDILDQQMLYRHALKGNKVACFTNIRSCDTLKEDFETFDWDVPSLEITEKRVLVDVHAPSAGGCRGNRQTNTNEKTRKTIYTPRLIPFNITERGIVIEIAVRIA